MTLVLVLLVGGMMGWLASLLMRTELHRGIFLNVAVGIVGALIAGILVTPLVGGATIASGTFDAASLIASLLGAVTMLSLFNVIRRGSPR